MALAAVASLRDFTRKKLFQDTFWFTLSNIFFQGSKFLTYLYAAKLLGPTTYGLWNGLLLILTYGMNSHCGVLNAMNREIPYYEGAGQPEKVAEVRNITAAVVLFTAVPLSLAVCASSLLPSLEPETAKGLRLVGVILFLQQLYLYFQMLLKSHGLFRLMSLQQVYFGVLSLALVLAGTKFFGFSGFLVAQIAVTCLILFYLAAKVPLKLNPVLDMQRVKALAKVGFPIMVVGLAYGLLITVDRIMILRFLGKEQLGYYSLSIMATGILTLFPMTVAQVTYPAMVRKYGESRDLRALADLVFRPTKLVAGVMLIVLAIVYFLLPPLVQAFLPEYITGIPALKITIWGMFFLSLVGGFANFLNTIGMQVQYLAIQVLTVAVIVLLNLCFIHGGYGVNGVAVATSITYVIYAGMMAGFVLYVLKKRCRS